jgi:hypothetical protein
VNDGEAEPPARELRREERIERAPPRPGVHPPAVVDDLEHDTAAVAAVPHARPDEDLPAGADRLRRVDHEVEDDLLDLRALPGDDREVIREVEDERAGRGGPRKVGVEGSDDLREVERLRLELGPAGVREHLPGERSGAARGGLHLAYVGLRRRRQRAVEEDELRVREDDREDVVEIVRHPAGEHREALEPERLGDLRVVPAPVFLRLDALGLVADAEQGPLGERRRRDPCVEAAR